SAYQAATLAGLGSITIGGTTYPIAAGTALSGADQIVLGSHFCLTARVSASGQIVPPSSIAAGATTTINVCGTVTAYQAATANANGLITINGITYPIAAGTVITGADQIVIGAQFCLGA